MSVTSLASYSFAFNDFVFGGSNSPYQILSVDGLEDLPGIRNQDDNRGYIDGMFTGRDFLSGRSIIITIQVLAGQGSSMTANLKAMENVLKPQQSGVGILNFQIPGSNLQRVGARVRRRAVTIDPDFSYGKAIVTYEFFCPDPRRYDETLNTQDIAVASVSTNGRTYNRVYTTPANPGQNPLQSGLSYGGGVLTSNLIINNGNVTTYPTITIYGPATNPVVTNSTTNQSLVINYTMTTSDVIVLDTDFRSVTLNGVSRRAILNNSSSWFGADPGNSYYNFAATGTSASTACVVSWRSAYI